MERELEMASCVRVYSVVDWCVCVSVCVCVCVCVCLCVLVYLFIYVSFLISFEVRVFSFR